MWKLDAPAMLALFAAAALLLPLSACGNSAPVIDNGDKTTLDAVRGLVVEVEAESLISLAALAVQDDEGIIWRFEGRGKVVPGFTPSHLNEHKLLGQSIEVAFYREGEALIIHDITD